MSLTSTAIKRPVAIIMLFLAIVVLGFQAMRRMPVDLIPDVTVPVASIITVYKGAGPNEIETQISKKVEDAVASINGVKAVHSYSQDSVSSVVIEFTVGTDIDVAANDIRDKLNAASSSLPDDAEDPIIFKLDFNAMPIMYIGISGNRSLLEVKELTEDTIKDRLGKIDGVASVSLSGGVDREILIKTDQDRLKAHGFNITEITQALAYANVNVPGGNIKQGIRDYSVRVVGEFNSTDQIANTKLRHANSAMPTPVTLSDVAQVLDTTAQQDSFARLNLKDSVGLVIQKQSDANTVKVAEGVTKEIAELKKELPKDITIEVAHDSSTFIKDSLNDVTHNLIEAALLATLVVFVFLHVFRATFIVLLAIPTSIMAAFFPISYAGFSLNVMTLMGLALSVGILVDDSIVVLENIFRHLVMGEKPEDAALNGRMEIGGAAVAITMTDVVIYVPIALMGGVVGQFFKDFGITIATATLFSLFVSFTLTPMLAAKLLRTEDAQLAEGESSRRGPFVAFARAFDRMFSRLSESYRGALKWALRHRIAVIIAANAILVVTIIGIGPFLGFEFMPRTDKGELAITMEMPVGTRIEETDRVTKIIESTLLDKKKYKEVKSVFTTVGESASMVGAGSKSSNIASISVKLVEKSERDRSVFTIASALSKEFATLPGPKNLTISTDGSNGGGESPVQLQIMGTNTKAVMDYANTAMKVVENTKGTRDVALSWEYGKPEYQIKVDRDRAAQYGLTVYQIGATVRNSIEGSTETKYRVEGDEYDIRVKLDEEQRQTQQDLENIILGGAYGRNILLKDIADVTLGNGPTKLERKNKQRLVTITAQLDEGYPLGNIISSITSDIEKTQRPTGVTYFFSGEADRMKDSGVRMITALALAVLLVYMLMCALYESLLYPFIIMFSLPQALVGALLALFLANKSLSIISMIGIIMLVGLVTKNAILLVDYTNTLRLRGRKRNDALIEAGPIRLRPILMTTLTVILGNLPIALGLGQGSEQRAPMSVAVIGGLLVSMLLTLFVIPCTYSAMDDFAKFLKRIVGSKSLDRFDIAHAELAAAEKAMTEIED